MKSCEIRPTTTGKRHENAFQRPFTIRSKFAYHAADSGPDSASLVPCSHEKPPSRIDEFVAVCTALMCATNVSNQGGPPEGNAELGTQRSAVDPSSPIESPLTRPASSAF